MKVFYHTTLEDPFLSSTSKGPCKGICKKYQATRPAGGMGRYASGQVRCQVCDIFMTKSGCHDKSGKPATEDALGLVCNCCNYRVTSRPRSKFYNEKFKNSQKVKPEIFNTEKNLKKSYTDETSTDTGNNSEYTKWLKANEYAPNDSLYLNEKDNFSHTDNSLDETSKTEKDLDDKKELHSKNEDEKTDKEIIANYTELENSKKLMEELLSKDKNLYEMFENIDKKLKFLRPEEIREIIKNQFD